MRRDLHEANRLSWNEATRAHNSHKGDQAAFFRAGASRNPTFGTLARLCEKHAITWEELDHAMNVKNRIIRA